MDSFQSYLQQFLNLLGIPYLLEALHATLEYFQSLLVTGNCLLYTSDAADE